MSIASPLNGPARFALVDDDRELRLGLFDSLSGFFTGHTAVESYLAFVEDSAWFPVEFTAGGLRPSQPMSSGDEFGWCSVEILTSSGEAVGFYDMTSVELESVRPRPGGSVDVTVTALMSKLPERGVDALWARWLDGPPPVAGTWAELPGGQREAWLEVAAGYRWRDRLRRGPAEGPLSLDGRFVTDVASVYCALGEAANGPGGYYGSNPYALRDCLSGGWGRAAPFTLVWEAFAVARDQVDEAGLGAVLGVLEEAGVTIDKR